MPFNPKDPTTKAQSESGDIESGVRRALGLGSSGSTQKRRFVRDGEVPVVTVRGRRDIPSDDAVPAKPDRAALDRAERAERALAAAQTTIRDLQTQLAHMAIARDEAVATARAAVQEKLAAELVVVPAPRVKEVVAPTEDVPVKRRPGRPPGSKNLKPPSTTPREKKVKVREPKPVKWWVKAKA